MHSVNLSQAVRMWPTPQTVDHKKPRPLRLKADRQTRDPELPGNYRGDLADVIGGQLNPDFVEWLMHWPRNWTSLEPMRTIDYISWLMGSSHATKNRTTEEVRELRNADDAQGVRNATGGHGGFQAAEVLLPELRQHAEESEAHWWSGAEAPEGAMRNMRIAESQTGAPQGQEQGEQRAGEYSDALRELPHSIALERGQDAEAEKVPAELRCLWEGDNTGAVRYSQDQVQAAWERATGEEKDWIRLALLRGVWHSEWPGVPRVAVGVPKRVDRLKAIGNGQVPAAAALAWTTLYERITNRS